MKKLRSRNNRTYNTLKKYCIVADGDYDTTCTRLLIVSLLQFQLRFQFILINAYIMFMLWCPTTTNYLPSAYVTFVFVMNIMPLSASVCSGLSWVFDKQLFII